MGRDPHCKAENQEWSSDRRFDPSQRYADDVDLALVEDSNFDDAWTYVACDEDEPCRDCGRLAPHLDCLVIAVDGACRQNGKSTAVASIGVFVHGNSSYNSSRLLHKPKVTNQLAELWAGVEALQLAIRIRDEGMIEYPLRQAVIKADSEYFVRGMTEWKFKWERNGFRNSKGKPLENSSVFQVLQMLVTKLNGMGVEVLFWHVRREQNTEADKLAKRALRNLGK